MRRIKLPRRSPGLQAVLGLTAFAVLGFVIALGIGMYASQQERCDVECKRVGLPGQLVPRYSLIQAGGNQARRGPFECKCAPYRTQ